MLKRWFIYCKEMFNLLFSASLSVLAFFEIYFLLLLNYEFVDFSIGIQELVGCLTIFSFLFLLRIVDDFKDYKTDLKEHPERPLPSGRVTKRDLIILLILILFVTLILNLLYMNNIIFLLAVILYGAFMSIWYCYSKVLKKNFIFMMFTHTPYLLLMNIYIISFTFIKYGLENITYITILLSFTIYFIGFLRGVSREIEIAKNKVRKFNDFQIKKYKKYSIFIGILAVFNTIMHIILLWNINNVSILFFTINLIYFLVKIHYFLKTNLSKEINILNKTLTYICAQEGIVLLSLIFAIIGG